MPCKGVRDAFYRGIGGIPYCRTKHPLHSCKVSERQKPGRLPPATKSLDFFEDFSRFSAHPSHNLLKSLCTKGKTNVRDVFYPSHISHIIPHIMFMLPGAALVQCNCISCHISIFFLFPLLFYLITFYLDGWADGEFLGLSLHCVAIQAALHIGIQV